jgi:hypothetical protein
MALVAVVIAAPEVSAAAAKPSTTVRTTTSRRPTVNHRLTTTTQPRPPTVKKTTIKVTPTQARTVARRATRVGTIQKKRHKSHVHGHGSHGPVHGIVTGVQHGKSGGAFEVKVVHKHYKHYHSKKSGRSAFRRAGGARVARRPVTTSVKRATRVTSSDRKFYVTTHTGFLAMRGSRGANTVRQVSFTELKRGDEVLVFANKSIAHKVDILGHHKHHKKSKKKQSV